MDRGAAGSPYFSAKLSKHATLWLLATMRRLAQTTGPTLVTVALCAFRGEFQKLTTLMASGPWSL